MNLTIGQKPNAWALYYVFKNDELSTFQYYLELHTKRVHLGERFIHPDALLQLFFNPYYTNPVYKPSLPHHSTLDAFDSK